MIGHTDRITYGQMDGQMDRQMGRQMDKSDSSIPPPPPIYKGARGQIQIQHIASKISITVHDICQYLKRIKKNKAE